MEEKSPQNTKLRKRTAKDSSDSVEEKKPINGSVKSAHERAEKLKSDEPAEEQKTLKGDDVARSGTQPWDWEKLFRITLEFDGIAVILFVVSFLTRTFRLSQPNHIVFDELHYGKYIRMYNEKTFFFDQHPPLGKQLIAAVTNLVGFGNYTFSKIGASYNEVSGGINKLDDP